MATNDQNEGPQKGQIVLYQIASTHAILPAIINRVNADGTVNLAQFPAPGATAFIDRASVGYVTALDGVSALTDNRWAYMPFF